MQRETGSVPKKSCDLDGLRHFCPSAIARADPLCRPPRRASQMYILLCRLPWVVWVLGNIIYLTNETEFATYRILRLGYDLGSYFVLLE